MLIRLTLILALLVPQLTLPALIAISTRCETAPCCEVVERTTCCGEETGEVRCEQLWDDCRCKLESGGSETPAPTPATVESTGLAFVLLAGEVFVANEWPQCSRVIGPGALGRPFRSHNTQQAFLGIWRT